MKFVEALQGLGLVAPLIITGIIFVCFWLDHQNDAWQSARKTALFSIFVCFYTGDRYFMIDNSHEMLKMLIGQCGITILLNIVWIVRYFCYKKTTKKH